MKNSVLDFVIRLGGKFWWWDDYDDDVCFLFLEKKLGWWRLM